MSKNLKKLYEDKRKKLLEIKPCRNCKHVFNTYQRKTIQENNKDYKIGKIKSKTSDLDNGSVEVHYALKELIGANIINTGFITFDGERDTEGGLAIDFEKKGKKMRLVLGYNELGEWLYYFGDK